MKEYNNIKSSVTPREEVNDTEAEVVDHTKSPPEQFAQGSQGRQAPKRQSTGIQMSTFRTNNEDIQIEGLNLEFERQDPLNSTQTNALLNVQHGNFDRLLQQVYYSPNCQYFYIGLLATCCILIITTIIDGFKIAESPTFIFIEFLLNATISVDLGLRVKMYGFKNYLNKNKIWNKLDVLIVILCNILFFLSIIFHVAFVEINEELLLVAWSIAQSFRMLLIARKQRQAIRSAKNLIDFTNIGLETEALDRQNHAPEVEEIITFQEPGAQRRSVRGMLGHESQSKLSNMGERQKALNSKRKYRTSNASDEPDIEIQQPSPSPVERRQIDAEDSINTDRYAL